MADTARHPFDSEAGALLRRARERIAAPEAQTRWVFARDAAGHPVAPTSPWAVSWCVAGALLADGRPRPSDLERAAGRFLPAALLAEERRPRTRRAAAVLLRAFALLDQAAPGPAPRLSAAAWLNNTAEHAETLAMLDRAIRLADAREPTTPEL